MNCPSPDRTNCCRRHFGCLKTNNHQTLRALMLSCLVLSIHLESVFRILASSFFDMMYLLGRLLYTTGDVSGAVRHFLGLLRWSSASSSPLARLSSHTVDITKDPSNSDKVFLEDFQVAISVMYLFPSLLRPSDAIYQHLKSISGEQARLEDVKLPLRFVVPSQACVRLARDSVEGEQSEWETREEIWSSFWKSRGKEKLERSGNAAVEGNYLGHHLTSWTHLSCRGILG